jgi:hypothetical protein
MSARLIRRLQPPEPLTAPSAAKVRAARLSPPTHPARGAQEERRIAVAGSVDFVLHLNLSRQVRPIGDHCHNAIGARADQDVRLIVDRHWLWHSFWPFGPGQGHLQL